MLPNLVGRYRLLGPVGAGGMGEVFVAHDTVLDRPVAIKRLHGDETSGARSFEKLREEARLNAQLQHPNVVTVYDVVREDAIDYIVSEFVDGDSLHDLVAASALELPRALEILTGVARGLEYAHARKVVHLDLKSENVLIGRDHAVKIADFGIAHSIADTAPRVAAADPDALPLGTPRVMSPEQSRGEATDERSDLFSLGVLAYEIVGRASPFLCGSAGQTLHAIRSLRHRPLADAAPGIPVELSELVDRLLEKQPALRPQRAADVVSELEAIRKRLVGSETARGAPAAERRRVAALSIVTAPDDAAFAEAPLRAERFVAFYEYLAAEAKNAGGEVLSACGGEVLVCFGHLRSNEDDCERAASLAMDVLRHPTWGNAGPVFSLRAGLDVGDVVVAPALDRTLVLGAAIDRAMRLARTVGRGELLVTMAAQPRLAGRYHLVPRSYLRPEREAGEAAEAVHALGPCYEVVARSPLGQTTSAIAAPLVGRDELVASLHTALAAAKGSDRRALALRGEPGVGKSRIAAELRRGWEARGAKTLVARGTLEAQYSPFAALRPILEAWFGVEADEPATVRRRIDESLARGGTSSADGDVVTALRVMCGCADDGDRARVRSLYQQEQRGELEDALVALVLREARQGEIVVLAEDTQWFDVASAGVVARLVDETDVPLVMTSRADDPHAFASKPRVSAHEVPRLTAASARKLVAALASQPLEGDVVERILASSDGLPLVIEELTRAAIAGGVDALAQVSSSLGDQVGATLEQLGPVLRRPLQLASLLGSRVPKDELVSVTGDDTRTAGYLDALVERGLLRADTEASSYLAFSHPLVRDEIAKRIPRGHEAELHRTIVETFGGEHTTKRWPPEKLAPHCERGGLPERAAEAWRRAGLSAAENGAYATAVGHYDRALAIVPSCASEARAVELEIEVRASRGAALAMAEGWGADSVAANSRALASAMRRGGRGPNPTALWQDWAGGYATGNMLAVTESLGQLEDLVATVPDAGILAYLLQCARGITYLHLGRLPQARAALERAQTEQPLHLDALRSIGQPEPILGPAAYLAWIDLLVGDQTRAFARQRAIEEDPASDPLLRVCATSFGNTLMLGAGETALAVARAEKVLSPEGAGLAPQHKAAATLTVAIGRLCSAASDASIDVPTAIRAMREAFEAWRAGFMRAGGLVTSVRMAEACLAVAASSARDADARRAADEEGRDILDFVLREVTALDPAIHRYFASEAFRVEALWRRHAGDHERAAEAMREARTRAQRIDGGEHGGAWFLLERLATAPPGGAP